ncbi:hypothetical protein [Streptomyces sp. NPDC055912]|uniref:hypothetical protein n=1 Tax=unclassified Streptomyces TaxID=2593676 RepID=UPI0035D97C9E
MSPRRAGTTPHPKDAEIRQLLADGATNAEVRRRLKVGGKPVARIRAAAGIPSVPRSAWSYRPHPKAEEVHALLAEGYSNAEISRRTGAAVTAVARMRRDGGHGPSTIRPTTTRWAGSYPKADQIRELLRHHSNGEIARRLHADPKIISRIRTEAGIVHVPARFATAEAKWATLVREVDGGHLEWLGERGSRGGTPVMRFGGRSVTPAGIAFTQRTGRPPVGLVRSECGYTGCLAPAHVDDEAGRRHVRSQLRRLRGLPDPPARCRHGHDQATEGAFEDDGTPYCRACKRDQKQAARPAATSKEGTR